MKSSVPRFRLLKIDSTSIVKTRKTEGVINLMRFLFQILYFESVVSLINFFFDNLINKVESNVVSKRIIKTLTH